jgi:hypothetical protein
MLVSSDGQHLQHMQKALGPLNVKLTEVVSDITGVTGTAIGWFAWWARSCWRAKKRKSDDRV